MGGAGPGELGGDAVGDDLGLSVREHARFRQHEWHIWLPSSGNGDHRHVTQGVHVVVLGFHGGAIYRDPTGLVGQPGLTHHAWAAMRRDGDEQIGFERLFAFKRQFTRRGIHRRQLVQRVKHNAFPGQHLLDGLAQRWPGDRHGLWLRGEQMHFHFVAQAASAENVGDEHGAFVRCAGAFVGQGAHHHSHFPAAEVP